MKLSARVASVPALALLLTALGPGFAPGFVSGLAPSLSPELAAQAHAHGDHASPYAEFAGREIARARGYGGV